MRSNASRTIRPAASNWSTSCLVSAVMVLSATDAARQCARNLGERSTALVRHSLNASCTAASALLAARRLVDHLLPHQRRHDVARQHERILADEAQKERARVSAEPLPAPLQLIPQSDDVVRGPRREVVAEPAVFGAHVADELRVAAHRCDLLSVAHDAFVFAQPLQIFIGQHRARRGVETIERRLESGPFVLDDLPDEAGPKNTLGHFGQIAIVGDTLQLRSRFGFWQQRFQLLRAAFTCAALSKITENDCNCTPSMVRSAMIDVVDKPRQATLHPKLKALLDDETHSQKGYVYCTSCGHVISHIDHRIEVGRQSRSPFHQPASFPFPPGLLS